MEEKVDLITQRHSQHLLATGKRPAANVERILQQGTSKTQQRTIQQNCTFQFSFKTLFRGVFRAMAGAESSKPWFESSCHPHE